MISEEIVLWFTTILICEVWRRHFNHDRHLNRRDFFKLYRSVALAEWRQLAGVVTLWNCGRRNFVGLVFLKRQRLRSATRSWRHLETGVMFFGISNGAGR